MTSAPTPPSPTTGHTSAAASAALIVRVGSDAYAVPIWHVREILRGPRIARVPSDMPGLIGVATVHDRAVAVVDLRRRFGVASPEVTDRARVVIVRIPSALVGLVVDDVEAVRRLPSAHVQPAPGLSFGSAERSWLAGVVNDGGRLLLCLRVGAIFSPEESRQLAAIRTVSNGDRA